MGNKYNVGRTEVSINNNDVIVVEDLDVQVLPNEVEVMSAYLDEPRKHKIGPPKFCVGFNVAPVNISESQAWFHEFNNTHLIGNHLAKTSLTVYVVPEFTLRLIGYLVLEKIEYAYGNQLFHFEFNGLRGEDVENVPDPYANNYVVSFAESKQTPKPIPKPMTISKEKITVSNTPKIIKNVSFTRDRKITF
jgi:hypothetical protein